MIDLKRLVRPNILELQPYSCARDEFSGKDGIFLDANENPFGKLNRYPDPHQNKVKLKLAELKKVDFTNIFVGNGSDEIIDLIFRIFCRPGVDKALIFTPTYGMYEVSAAINDIELIKLPLNNEFQINLEKVKEYLEDINLKLIFICSPNNPTGNLINKEDIEFIVKDFNGIVIVDEAYIDFAKTNSLIYSITKYNNLIVSQTLSKAWGLAAARVGLAYANEEIITLLNKLKPPYNVSELNQNAALQALQNTNLYKENLENILLEKEKLKTDLLQLEFVKKVYPSDANFFLIEVENADKIYTFLINQRIITRNRNKQVTNCIRITVGTPKENQILITALKNIQ